MIVPGTIAVAGDADARAVVEVVDIVPKSSAASPRRPHRPQVVRDRVRQLAPEDGLDLISEPWDSLDTDDIAVTAAEREQMDERLADLEANPGAGRSWDEVERGLRARR